MEADSHCDDREQESVRELSEDAHTIDSPSHPDSVVTLGLAGLALPRTLSPSPPSQAHIVSLPTVLAAPAHSRGASSLHRSPPNSSAGTPAALSATAAPLDAARAMTEYIHSPALSPRRNETGTSRGVDAVCRDTTAAVSGTAGDVSGEGIRQAHGRGAVACTIPMDDGHSIQAGFVAGASGDAAVSVPDFPCGSSFSVQADEEGRGAIDCNSNANSLRPGSGAQGTTERSPAMMPLDRRSLLGEDAAVRRAGRGVAGSPASVCDEALAAMAEKPALRRRSQWSEWRRQAAGSEAESPFVPATTTTETEPASAIHNREEMTPPSSPLSPSRFSPGGTLLPLPSRAPPAATLSSPSLSASSVFTTAAPFSPPLVPVLARSRSLSPSDAAARLVFGCPRRHAHGQVTRAHPAIPVLPLPPAPPSPLSPLSLSAPQPVSPSQQQNFPSAPPAPVSPASPLLPQPPIPPPTFPSAPPAPVPPASPPPPSPPPSSTAERSLLRPPPLLLDALPAAPALRRRLLLQLGCTPPRRDDQASGENGMARRSPACPVRLPQSSTSPTLSPAPSALSPLPPSLQAMASQPSPRWVPFSSPPPASASLNPTGHRSHGTDVLTVAASHEGLPASPRLRRRHSALVSDMTTLSSSSPTLAREAQSPPPSPPALHPPAPARSARSQPPAPYLTPPPPSQPPLDSAALSAPPFQHASSLRRRAVGQACSPLSPESGKDPVPASATTAETQSSPARPSRATWEQRRAERRPPLYADNPPWAPPTGEDRRWCEGASDVQGILRATSSEPPSLSHIMGHSRLPPPPPLLPLDALCPPLPPAPVRRPVPVASASPHGVSPDAAPRAVHRPPVPPSVPPLEVMCPPVPAPPRRRPVPTVDVAPTRIPVVVVGGGSGRGRAEGYDISSNENEPDAEEDSEADEVRALHLRWLEMLELQRALNLSSAEFQAARAVSRSPARRPSPPPLPPAVPSYWAPPPPATYIPPPAASLPPPAGIMPPPLPPPSGLPPGLTGWPWPRAHIPEPRHRSNSTANNHDNSSGSRSGFRARSLPPLLAPSRPPPVRLSTPDSDDAADNVCPICYDALATTATVALRPCGHRFHRACAEAWLRPAHQTCPMCRAAVTAAAELSEEG